jgi:hypothetical protein
VVYPLETGAHVTQAEGMNAAEVGDPCSVVRKLLEDIAPCETGYVGVTTCQTCGGTWCADILEKALKEKDPSMDWRPAIREVLGLW